MPSRLLGVDFSCAPSRRKPITVAHGRRRGGVLQLQRIDTLHTLAEFEALLAQPGPWFGAFDFPFGLPRAFVDAQALGSDTATVIHALRQRCPDRRAWRALVDAWGNGRPAGQRLVHRRTDTAMTGIRSTSPLQTRYVPVGFMYFEGLWRLVRAGVSLPLLHAGDPARVAVEAYPGLLAHELIGRRSYKNRDDAPRRAARQELLDALQCGHGRLGLRVCFDAALGETLLADAGGDRLDALLCLVQAAWARDRPRAGLPPHLDPVEGWIATVP